MADARFGTSRLSRLASMSKLGVKAVGARVSRRGHEKLAKVLVQELGQMKGLPMKVGQLLSFMDGVVPQAHRELYSDALATLRAHAPVFDNARCLAIIERDFGPIDDVFDDFNESPIASASIGQVYSAALGETPVCVKVQYPGIREATMSDMKNVDSLMAVFSTISPTIDVKSVIENFKERLHEEFDCKREAEMQSRFYEIYREHKDIVVPAVFRDLCSVDVITSERIEGESLEQFLQTSDESERTKAGLALFEFAFGSLLKHGLFHADPHPGNVFFRSTNQGLGVIDFGCVQPFSNDDRSRLRKLLQTAASGESIRTALVDALQLDVDENTLDLVEKVSRMILEPIWAPQPFRFSSDFSTRVTRELMEAKLALGRKMLTRKARFRADADGFLFIARNLLGLAHIWGALRCEGDFRQVILQMCDEG